MTIKIKQKVIKKIEAEIMGQIVHQKEQYLVFDVYSSTFNVARWDNIQRILLDAGHKTYWFSIRQIPIDFMMEMQLTIGLIETGDES